ncbi:MAG: cytochrome P460 family protein [Amphritea sp.]|nr:cytochrome P460 family protein [Amphritea sp.]
MSVKSFLIIGLLGVSLSLPAQEPFGDKASVDFAAGIWQQMIDNRLAGDQASVTRPYIGLPPHGQILELIEQTVTVNGRAGELVIKRNYGGNGLTVEDVINNPNRYLDSITVMFRREAGYDQINGNWYYAKFNPDGSLQDNPKGVPLAGRVAKGMATGCIACHRAAGGDDFIFNHDRYKER